MKSLLLVLALTLAACSSQDAPAVPIPKIITVHHGTPTPTPTPSPTATPRPSPTPSVVTNNATNVATTSASLNGLVNPEGLATTWHMDWGLTTSYGNSTQTRTAGSGQQNVAKSTKVSGLTSGTGYHYRIVATNSAGTAHGLDKSFTTLSTPTPTPTSTPTPTPSGIIPADRLTDWTPGIITGVPGGIPVRTTIFVNVKTVLNDSPYHCAGDGTTDDSTALAAALNACPSGQVVYMPAATYKLAKWIYTNTHSGWTLRGDGPGNTILMGYGTQSTMLQSGTSDYPTPLANIAISAGATKNSSTITVASTSGGTLGYSGIVDGKLIRIEAGTNPPYVHPLNGGGSTPLSFMFKVVSHTATTITFSPKLPIDLSAYSPKLAFYPTSSLYFLGDGMGVEDLTVDLNNFTSSGGFWQLEQSWGCWMKNVEVKNVPNKQVLWTAVSQSEIRHCYFHDMRGGGPGHEGVDLVNYCAWNLIEDNITIAAGFPHIMLSDGGAASSGNVIAYNYCYNVDVGAPDTDGWEIGMNHGSHNSFNLAEGNIAGMISTDGYWGSASHDTIARNWLTMTHPTATDGIRGMDFCHFSNYFNVVGNVIGYPSISAIYEGTADSYPNTTKVIYRLGFPNSGNTDYNGTVGPNTPPDYSSEGSTLVTAQKRDLNVASNIIRHGNYDYVTNGIVWSASIPDHNIPNSYFRTAKPDWFDTLTWPPIDPASPPGAVNNTNISKIPAGFRYVNGYDPGHSPTPTPTPPPPSPTPARPYGLAVLYATGTHPSSSLPGYTNPAAIGVAFRTTWALIETADNTYDWTDLDAAATLSVTYSKQTYIYFSSTVDHPAWLSSQTVNVGNTQHPELMCVPWKNPFHDKWIEFIGALGARYNGVTKPRFTAIIMGGFGAGGSSKMTADPVIQAQLDAILDDQGNGGLAAWKIACADFIAAHFAAFPIEALIFNGKNPYGDTAEGGTALSDVLLSQIALHPLRFGVMTPDLAYNSHAIGVNAIIQSYSVTQPVGFQLRANSAGSFGIDLACPTGTDPEVCLGLVMTNGASLGAHWLHVYASDMDNPDFQDTLLAAGSQFIQWAWMSPNLANHLYAGN